jgi:hypothetical protein
VTGPHRERIVTDMPAAMGGAAAKLGVVLSALEIAVESESDNRGILGLDESVSAGLGGVRMKVRIAGDATPRALRDIVAWADAHSPVGCTLRSAPVYSLEVQVGP